MRVDSSSITVRVTAGSAGERGGGAGATVCAPPCSAAHQAIGSTTDFMRSILVRGPASMFFRGPSTPTRAPGAGSIPAQFVPMSDKTLVLVDGSSYLYRAFHALPDL